MSNPFLFFLTWHLALELLFSLLFFLRARSDFLCVLNMAVLILQTLDKSDLYGWLFKMDDCCRKANYLLYLFWEPRTFCLFAVRREKGYKTRKKFLSCRLSDKHHHLLLDQTGIYSWEKIRKSLTWLNLNYSGSQSPSFLCIFIKLLIKIMQYTL